MSMTAIPSHTPWGRADQITTIPVGNDGVLGIVATPSHGGIYVPNSLLARIPAEAQRWAASWSGSPNWYEEDVCALVVGLAFLGPMATQYGDNITVEGCRSTLRHYLSEACLDDLENAN